VGKVDRIWEELETDSYESATQAISAHPL